MKKLISHCLSLSVCVEFFIHFFPPLRAESKEGFRFYSVFYRFALELLSPQCYPPGGNNDSELKLYHFHGNGNCTFVRLNLFVVVEEDAWESHRKLLETEGIEAEADAIN